MVRITVSFSSNTAFVVSQGNPLIWGKIFHWPKRPLSLNCGVINKAIIHATNTLNHFSTPHAGSFTNVFTYRMEENWDELYKRLPPALSMLGSMVQIMTSSFTKPEQLAKVEAFFKDKNTNGYDQSLAQSMDSVRSKIAWLGRDRSDVAAWLKENGYGA